MYPPYMTDKHIKIIFNNKFKFCKNANINIVSSPFKIGSLFLSKDLLPDVLKSFVVNRFTCSGCQSRYIDEGRCH